MEGHWDWVIFFGFAIFFAGFGTYQKIKNFVPNKKEEYQKHPSLDVLRDALKMLATETTSVETKELSRGDVVTVPKNPGKMAGKRKTAVFIMEMDGKAVLTSPKDRNRTYRRPMSEVSF